MRKTSRSLLLLGLMAGVGCGSAEPTNPSESFTTKARAAIEGGSLDLDHKAVFFLINGQRDSGAMCTSTLIAPNLLLTARHCVAPADGETVVVCGRSELGAPYDGSVFHTTNDAEPSRASQMFRGRVKGARVPSEGSDTCGYDIALLILESNVPSSIAVPAVPRIDQPVTRGELYTAIGYGVDASEDWTGGRMRLDGLKVECEPGLCGYGVEATEFRGDRGTCSGDSGGPAIDAHGRVLGVVSRATSDCRSPIYGTVYEWRDWIATVAKEAAQLGAYDPPTWVTTGRTDPPDGQNPGPGGPDPTTPIEPTQPSREPIVPKGVQGDACRAETDCATDFACYTPDGQASSAYCAARCSAAVACGSGYACADSIGVCLAHVQTVATTESSGCSLPARPARLPSGALAAALGALALVTLRRRNRKHHCSSGAQLPPQRSEFFGVPPSDFGAPPPKR